IPSWVAAADFNGDGEVDLAVTNALGGDASILLGDGAGAFGSPNHFVTGSTPTQVATADLNRDGKADLVFLNDGSIGVLLGNGDGPLGPPAHFAAGDTPTSFVLRDVDGDGFVDVAVTDWGKDKLQILLGNGNGTFAAAKTWSVLGASGPF